MFLEKKKVLLSIALTCSLLFTTEFGVLAAEPQSEAQAIATLKQDTKPLAGIWNEISEMALIAENTQVWYGKALANTDDKMNIYTAADESSAVAGIMYYNTVVAVEETTEEWSKISSGDITGYVKNEMLLTGSAAVERAAVACANGYQDARSAQDLDAEKLMAAIIFCEAGNQPYDGKVAVGAVIMNRVESGRFPNTIKAVIYQRGQFTPAMTGKLDRVLASGNIPSACYEAARDALNGSSPIGDMLFFNNSGSGYKLGDHYFR